jgi:hypothetical protein
VDASISSALGAEISGVTELSNESDSVKMTELSDKLEAADRTAFSCTGRNIVLFAEFNVRFKLTRSEIRSFNG